MKSNYSERKQARIEKFKELADKNKKLSDDLSTQASKMADFIPMGQPILIGHHSEQRDRNYRAKIGQKFSKSIEADKKADYYENRAETAENGTAISSDNPDAIVLLEKKLEELEKTQELYKAINKVVRLKKSDAEKVDAIVRLGVQESIAIELITPGRWGGMGIPSYRMTNNNATIRNTRQRLEQLKKVEALPESETVINGVTLAIVPADNRVKIFFPNIPDEKIRSELKHSGFHWSPSNGAWMRQISNQAVWAAKRILNESNS